MSDQTDLAVDPTNPSATLAYTLGLIRAGDLTTAEKLVNWALDFSPDHGGLLKRMSEISTARKDFAQALSWAHRAASADPANASYQDHLAMVFLELGQLESAEAAYERSLELQPNNAGVVLRLVGVKLRLDKVDEAQATILEAIGRQPDNVALMLRMSGLALGRRQYDLANDWVTRAIETKPNEFRSYIQKASLEVARGNLKAAASSLQKAVELSPGDVYLKRRLSDVLLRSGDAEGAHHWAAEGIASQPNDPEGYGHLANLFNLQGKLTETDRALRQAIDVSPSPTVAATYMRRLSQAAQRRGDPETSVDWAQQAVAANAADALNYGQLAAALLQHGRFVDAESALEHAVDLQPLDVGLLRRLSDLKMRLSKSEEAFALAERAIVVSPGDISSINHIAGLHLSAGDLEQTEIALTKGLERNPRSAVLMRRMSNVALYRHRNDLALVWVARAIEADPADISNYNQKTNLEIILGDLAAAEATLQHALEINPNNGLLKRRLSDVLMRRGNIEGALSLAAEVVAIDNNDSNNHVHLASVYAAQGSFNEAEAALQTAVAVSPGKGAAAGPMRRLSNLALTQGDMGKAFLWAQRAVDTNPYDAENHNHIAGLHLSHENFAGAEEATLRAIALSPRNVRLLRRMSDIRRRKGDLASAAEYGREAVAANRLDSHAFDNLSAVLMAQGDTKGAAEAARSALELAPENLQFARRVGYMMSVHGEESATTE